MSDEDDAAATADDANADDDDDADADDDDDDDLYIIGAVCLSVCHVFVYFAFLPFLDTFGYRNNRKSA